MVRTPTSKAGCKILWDFNVQCDHEIEHRRPDLIIMDKENRTALIIDVAVPGDNRVRGKDLAKNNKYQDLKSEITRMWTLKQVEVVPVVVGALGTVSKNTKGIFGKGWDSDTGGSTAKNCSSCWTARILRSVLDITETYCRT